MTSTMKSEPGRSVVYTSTRGGGGDVSAAASLAEGRVVVTPLLCASWAFRPPVSATSAAAPAAAPFRNPRRPPGFLPALLSLYFDILTPFNLTPVHYQNSGPNPLFGPHRRQSQKEFGPFLNSENRRDHSA